MLGIGEAALEESSDEAMELSGVVREETLFSGGSVWSSTEMRRRFRGRKVVELLVEVVVGNSVFIATKAHVVGLFAGHWRGVKLLFLPWSVLPGRNSHPEAL